MESVLGIMCVGLLFRRVYSVYVVVINFGVWISLALGRHTDGMCTAGIWHYLTNHENLRDHPIRPIKYIPSYVSGVSHSCMPFDSSILALSHAVASKL